MAAERDNACRLTEQLLESYRVRTEAGGASRDANPSVNEADVCRCCRLVELTFSDVVELRRLLLEKEDNASYYKVQVQFMETFTQTLKDVFAGYNHALAWLSVKLAVLSARLDDTSLFDHLQSASKTVFLLLSANAAEQVLSRLFAALADLMAINMAEESNRTGLGYSALKAFFAESPRLRWQDGAVFELADIEVPLQSLEDCERLQASLSVLLQWNVDAFAAQPTADLARFWVVLLQQVELTDVRLKTASLWLAQRLVSRHLCPAVFVPFLMDRLLALAECEQTEREAALRTALASCLVECGTQLSAADEVAGASTLLDCTAPTFADWFERASGLLLAAAVPPASPLHDALMQLFGGVVFALLQFDLFGQHERVAEHVHSVFIQMLQPACQLHLTAAQLLDYLSALVRLSERSNRCAPFHRRLSYIQHVAFSQPPYVFRLLSQAISQASAGWADGRELGTTLALSRLILTLLAMLAKQTFTSAHDHLRSLISSILNDLVAAQGLFACLTAISQASLDSTKLLLEWYRLLEAVVDGVMYFERVFTESVKRRLLTLASAAWVQNRDVFRKIGRQYADEESAFRAIAQLVDSECRALSLGCIARLPVADEARERPFLIALSLSDLGVVSAALEHLPTLLSSFDRDRANASGGALLQKSVMPLCVLPSEDDSLCEAAVRCVGRSVCAISQTRSAQSRSEAHRCLFCDDSADFSSARPIDGKSLYCQRTSDLFDRLCEIANNSSITRQSFCREFCKASTSLIVHTSTESATFVEKSTALFLRCCAIVKVGNSAVECAVPFCQLMVVVVRRLGDCAQVQTAVQEMLSELSGSADAAHLTVCFRLLFGALANLTTDTPFYNTCVTKLIILSTFGIAKSDDLDGVAKFLAALGVREQLTAVQLFRTHWAAACKYFVRELLDELSELAQPAADGADGRSPSPRRATAVSERFAALASLYAFVDANDMLDAAKQPLVAELLVGRDRRGGSGDALWLLKSLSSKLQTNRPTLVGVVCLPSIVQRLAVDSACDVNAVLGVVVSQCTADGGSTLTVENLISCAFFKCIESLLLSLSSNKESVLEWLRLLSGLRDGLTLRVPQRQPFDLSKFLNNYFFGILLSFRQIFCDDEPMPVKRTSLDSLMILLEELHENLLCRGCSKILNVLRVAVELPQLRRRTLDLFCVFVKRLSSRSLADILPQLIASLRLLFNDGNVDLVLRCVFEQARRLQRHNRQRYEDLCSVLSGPPEFAPFRVYLSAVASDMLESEMVAVVRLLKEGHSDVKALALTKLRYMLYARAGDVSKLMPTAGDSLNPVVSDLVSLLLDTVRSCDSDAIRMTIVECLGELGAVDPGRLGLQLSAPTQPGRAPRDRRAPPIVFARFVDAEPLKFDVPFARQLLQHMTRVYRSASDPGSHDNCSLGIQNALIALRLRGRSGGAGADGAQGPQLWRAVAERDREILQSLLETNYAETSKGMDPEKIERPVILGGMGNTYRNWLACWLLTLIPMVRHETARLLFRSSVDLAEVDSEFANYLMPHVVVQVIQEANPKHTEAVKEEMLAVLRLCSEGVGAADVREMAAQCVFNILDALDRWLSHSRADKTVAEARVKSVARLLREVKSESLNGRPLVAATAVHCHSFARALMAFEASLDSGQQLTQPQLCYVQELYMGLEDGDGIEGALTLTKRIAEPPAEQTMAALEACGSYTDALPFHQVRADDGGGMDAKLALMKCLLKLDVQPNMASLQQTSVDSRQTTRLNDVQMEAALKLRDWSGLQALLDEQPSAEAQCSWTRTQASLLLALRAEQSGALEQRLGAARRDVLCSLLAATMEGAAYERAYKHICKLSLLSDIDKARSFSKDDPAEHERILLQWDRRIKLMQHSVAALEPTLELRRLLMSLTPQYCPLQEKVYSYLLESAQLARRARHYTTAWGFLVKAKHLETRLNASSRNSFLEEAKFHWAKGDALPALGVLERGIETNFAELLGEVTMGGDGVASKFKRDDKEHFAKSNELLVEYTESASIKGSLELGQLYERFKHLHLKNEQIHYASATFIDRCQLPKQTRQELTEKPVTFILDLIDHYYRALKYGSRHAHHTMPRLLSIWLDYTAGKYELVLELQGDTAPTPALRGPSPPREPSLEDKLLRHIADVNERMLSYFDVLDNIQFYAAFSQLISRIEHAAPSVFQTLKTILSKLMVRYPQQCLWLSIGVRQSPRGSLKAQRCIDIYRAAIALQSDLQPLSDNFQLLAELFHAFACLPVKSSDGVPRELDRPMKDYCPELFGFFDEKPNAALLQKLNQRNLRRAGKPPDMMIPLQSLLDVATRADDEHPTSTQQLDGAAVTQPLSRAVFIDGFETNFKVMKSVQCPKVITIRGSDGNTYMIMCKPTDDLRKDKRYMEFCKVVNACLRHDAESRKRQLNVRTYSIIPLGDDGGLLEWVPHLSPMKKELMTLINERVGPMSDADRRRALGSSGGGGGGGVDRLLERFHKDLLPLHPAVMSEWLRRAFAEPCGWYAARLAFTRTSAVVSMVGFAIGLGDRHPDNILLDLRGGNVLHVDYNLLFYRGESLPVPERVPFRLTHNMRDGFGPLGVEGAFRRACQVTLRVLRDKKGMLLTVLQTFVHDPLVEWKREGRAQQRRQRRPTSADAAAGSGASQLSSAALGREQTKTAQEIMSAIHSRLSGYVETLVLHTRQEDTMPLGVEGQVAQLIDIASDDRNLCQMYLGWSSFL